MPPQDNQPEVYSIVIEDTREVNISSSEIPRLVHIAASLSQDQADLLFEVLRENIGQFAWSYQDMPGLDPKLVVHHLAVDPKIKPVRQKLRKMHPKVALLVKAKLERMLAAKVI